MENNHLYIVFGVEHYNPLGIIRSLGEKGIKTIFIAVKNKVRISSFSKYISKKYLVETIEDGYKILINEYGNMIDNPPFLFTSDDKTVAFLDERFEELKNRFIMFNSGEKSRTIKYMNKFDILELAKKCGLKTLETITVNKGEIPNNLVFPIITKSISPVVGGWKSDVHICKNKVELKKAYEKIDSPVVVLQKYIKKKNEYCIDGFSSNSGKNLFLAIESKYNYLIDGYYSPYMTVDNFKQESLYKGLKKMFKEIKFDGIFSIEFLIDKDDNYYFSEINFRNSTWSYASTVAGMNLPYLWANSMLSKKIDKSLYVKIKEPFTAMVEPIDYQKRVVERHMDIKKWIRELLECKCLYYYNKDDLEPFFEMIRNNEKLR